MAAVRFSTGDEQRGALCAVLMSSLGLLVTLKTGPTPENIVTTLVLIAAAMIGGLYWTKYGGWIGRFVLIELGFAVYFGVGLASWNTLFGLVFSVALATLWLVNGSMRMAVIIAVEAVVVLYFGWALSPMTIGVGIIALAILLGAWTSLRPLKQPEKK